MRLRNAVAVAGSAWCCDRRWCRPQLCVRARQKAGDRQLLAARGVPHRGAPFRHGDHGTDLLERGDLAVGPASECRREHRAAATTQPRGKARRHRTRLLCDPARRLCWLQHDLCRRERRRPRDEEPLAALEPRRHRLLPTQELRRPEVAAAEAAAAAVARLVLAAASRPGLAPRRLRVYERTISLTAQGEGLCRANGTQRASRAAAPGARAVGMMPCTRFRPILVCICPGTQRHDRRLDCIFCEVGDASEEHATCK